MSDSFIKSPCVGICSATSLGDEICVGCHRAFEEVIFWNQCDDQTKLDIIRKAAERKEGK